MTGEGRAPYEVLKVAAASKPVSVAGAIAGVIRVSSVSRFMLLVIAKSEQS